MIAAEDNNIHYMDSYFLLCSTDFIPFGCSKTFQWKHPKLAYYVDTPIFNMQRTAETEL